LLQSNPAQPTRVYAGGARAAEDATRGRDMVAGIVTGSARTRPSLSPHVPRRPPFAVGEQSDVSQSHVSVFKKKADLAGRAHGSILSFDSG